MKSPVTEQQFNNGSRLFTVAVPGSKMVEARLYFKAGFQYFDAANHHLPHLLEHLLLSNGGSAGSEQALVDQLQQLGADANATTDYQYLTILLRSPAEHFAAALQLVWSSVFAPQLTDELLAKEREVVIREIHESYDGLDARIANYLLYRSLGGMVPEQWDAHGGFVNKLDLAAVRSAYDNYIRPDNLLAIFAGDPEHTSTPDITKLFEPDAGAETATENETSAETKQSPLKPACQPVNPQAAGIDPVHLDLGRNASINLVFAGKFPAKTSLKQRAAFNVGMHMLFSAPSAVLPRLLREQGAVYSMDADMTLAADRQLIFVTAMADAKRTPAAALEILRQIKRFASQDDISQADLQSAKQYVSAAINASTDSAADLLEWYSVDILRGRKPNTPEREIKAMHGLEPADVAAAINSELVTADLYDAVACSDAAFWVPELEAQRQLIMAAEAGQLDVVVGQASSAVSAKRAAAPERVGYHWAGFYLLGFITTLLTIFFPYLHGVANPVTGQISYVSLMDFTFYTQPWWGGLFFVLLTLGNLTTYVKGRLERLAERLGILLWLVTAGLYAYGIHRYFGGGLGLSPFGWRATIGLLPTLFFYLAVPLATISVVRLIIRNRLHLSGRLLQS